MHAVQAWCLKRSSKNRATLRGQAAFISYRNLQALLHTHSAFSGVVFEEQELTDSATVLEGQTTKLVQQLLSVGSGV